MADEEHLAKLKEGVEVWNQWRDENPTIRPDLSGADLTQMDLTLVDLYEANLAGANLAGIHVYEARLAGANLPGTRLSGADLRAADFEGANLRGADLSWANLPNSNLRRVDLRDADLFRANLSGAQFFQAVLSHADLTRADLSDAHLVEAGAEMTNLSGANLQRADLMLANFFQADLSGADLRGTKLNMASFSESNLAGADLSEAYLFKADLVETNLEGANLVRCHVYGTSVWNVRLTGAQQLDIVITPFEEPEITVDNLEVAQFIYLLLHNEKIRGVLDTITSKAVLILGRFTEERKAVLNAIRDALRQRDYLPIVFDFERPTARDFTETIMTLAGMSLFVIADITNPKSSPLELQATVPNYMVPFVPIIQEGERPFSMFIDLKNKHPDWVLDLLVYDSAPTLVRKLGNAVIRPALKKHSELLAKKAEELRIRHAQDYPDDDESV
jgi:uncharacterized protein YjbI with pentapeptide repeats